MYRINLYPAGLEKRASQSASIRSIAMMSLLGGLNAVVLGFFLMTALAVKGQAEVVEGRVQSMKTRLIKIGTPGLQVATNQARALLERRAARVVWTPALNELRNNLSSDLILERLEASTSKNQDVFSGMQLYGRLRSGRNVEPVMTCLDRLWASSAYRSYFDRGKLDRVDNSQDVSRFVIACPLIRPTEPDPSEEGSGG